MTLNEKVELIIVKQSGKSVKIFIGLKKTCLGVLDTGDRDKNNERGLKEGGGMEMPITVLPLRDARSLRFCIYLPANPLKNFSICK